MVWFGFVLAEFSWKQLSPFCLFLALLQCAPASLLPLVLLSLLFLVPLLLLVFSPAPRTSRLLLGPCGRIAVQGWSFPLTETCSSQECNWGSPRSGPEDWIQFSAPVLSCMDRIFAYKKQHDLSWALNLLLSSLVPFYLVLDQENRE